MASAAPARLALMRYTATGGAEDEDLTTAWDAGEVCPGLWVGSLAAAESIHGLEANGITQIVTVAARLHPVVPLAIRCTEISLDDHPCADLLGKIGPALEAIDTALAASGGAVLVHCASGVSRSVATCVAWLMLRKGLSSDDALAQVRQCRSNANPNLGFKQALQILEAEGGNLEGAATRWQDTHREGLLERVRELRERANAFHARVDELEERLAQHKSCNFNSKNGTNGGSSEFPPDVLAALEALQDEIDDAAPQTEIDDRVSRVIRRAAVQKIERLIGNGGC